VPCIRGLALPVATIIRDGGGWYEEGEIWPTRTSKRGYLNHDFCLMWRTRAWLTAVKFIIDNAIDPKSFIGFLSGEAQNRA